MDEILLFVASMPTFVVHAMAGAIAGLLGAGAGLIAQKYFGLPKEWKFVPVVVFTVLSLNVSKWLFDDAVPAQEVSTLKQNRLFGVILKHHPEAEREYIEQYKKILSGPREQIRAQRRALAADFTARYLDFHMLTASDAAIHHVLQTEAGILEALKNSPTECVGQFLGTPSASRLEAIPRPLVEANLNAKAEIIESSVVAPSPPQQKTTNMEDLVGVVTRAYRTRGYDIAGSPNSRMCNPSRQPKVVRLATRLSQRFYRWMKSKARLSLKGCSPRENKLISGALSARASSDHGTCDGAENSAARVTHLPALRCDAREAWGHRWYRLGRCTGPLRTIADWAESKENRSAE
jgi:hypothetical protein